ncbi:MAG: hypothetical protein RLY20_1402 [Verrucomicrobiota bacterium]|jgi:hypothetical protein
MKNILFASTLVAAALPLVAADAPKVAPADPYGAQTFTGKVLETMNAATYTYVRVDTGKATNWAAASQFPVKVGDTVTIKDGMPMQNFPSKSLNRTFDVIYFSGSAAVAAAPGAAGKLPELPPGHPAIGGDKSAKATELPAGHPPIGDAAKKSIDFTGLKVPKNGKTVADIVTDSAKLNGKQVVVRGKVVKYNGGVMGKNWLHIRDGSGKEGSNDLTITTDTEAKLGDTVLVSGKVGTDRDFGAGYKYAVIIENAEVVVE